MAAPPAGATGPAQELPAGEAARMRAGEVLLAAQAVGPRGLEEQEGRGVIEAAPERVFMALTDFAHYQEWMPFVRRSDAAAQGDGSVVAFQALELPFPVGARHYKIRARWAVEEGGAGGRTWRLGWQYVPGSGNVAAHRGSWTLVAWAGGWTLGTCRLFTDPGGGVPGWAMNLGMTQTMPYIFSGLRQQIRRSRYLPP